MSDYIPFEIQLEIIKRAPDAKSLIRFRSVSKPWRSFIDSSDFLEGYVARHTQPHRLLLSYINLAEPRVAQHFSFVDGGNETFLTQQQHVPAVPDLMTQFNDTEVIGSSRGLLCLRSYEEEMFVLWNPSIRKSVRIKLPTVPFKYVFYGFAVCPVKNDPTIVIITKGFKVGLFTLSSKRYTEFRCTNLPPKLLSAVSTQILIDSFIYWTARDTILSKHGSHRDSYMIMCFNLVAKDIRLVDIPRGCILFDTSPVCFFLSKLRESLVLFVPNERVDVPDCGVWKMEDNESFTKLFTIKTPGYTINNILGFTKNGELVMETEKKEDTFAALELYQPCSEQVTNLGIYGQMCSFFMSSYKETLHLLGELDSCVCSKQK